MAARLAGSLHFQRRASVRRRRLYVLCAAVVLIVAAAVAARAIMMSRAAHEANIRTVQPQLSYGAKQAIDVNLVAGAVGQYAAANDVLPVRLAASNGSLVLCADTCTPSAYEVGGFNVYQPADIKLVPYAPGLTVPTQADMYLVPGAKCAGNGSIGAVNPNPRSMVILFVATTNSGVSPRCVVL